MKKVFYFLFIVIVSSSLHLSAQLINPNFDTWTRNTLSAGNAPDPNSGNGTSGWWDFNVASNKNYFGGSPLTVFKDSANPSPVGHSQYCAEIVSNAMTVVSYGLIKQYQFDYLDTLGVIFNGYIDASFFGVTIKRGIPFTSKITSFSFYYRYIPNGTDSCSCTVSLYHWSGGVRNLIGGGHWYNAATVNDWKQDSVVVSYDSTSPSTKIDTIFIQFSACSLLSKPQVGDTMDIDSTGYHLAPISTGTAIVTEPSCHVTLYPNPAQNEMNAVVAGQVRASEIEVYDITGRIIGTYTMRNNALIINTQLYTNGLYLYKIMDNNGNQLNTGKFSVVH